MTELSKADVEHIAHTLERLKAKAESARSPS